LGGGSFGAQIGADKTDYVLLIMNEKGLSGLLGDKFQIGGEVGVAAGPVGRTASAATDAQLKAEMRYSSTIKEKCSAALDTHPCTAQSFSHFSQSSGSIF